MTEKFWKILGLGIYILFLCFVSAKLFFEPQYNASVELIEKTFFSSSFKSSTLKMGFSTPINSFSPLKNDVSSRSRLINVYEGLVKTNADFEIIPGLALSFGAIDDKTWEFKVRPDVKFHSGRSLTLEDIKFSLEMARDDSNSDLKGLMKELIEIKILPGNKIHLITKRPDPLLLNKLAYVYIFPKSNKEFLRTKVIGTGPYLLLDIDNTKDLLLNRFEGYWGEIPFFKEVLLKEVTDKFKRVKMLMNYDLDVLAAVPPGEVEELKEEGMNVWIKPSLEVNFLVFNFNKLYAPILNDLKIRTTFKLAIDKVTVGDLGGGFVTPLNQFVGRGILGYNPRIENVSYDLKKAQETVLGIGLKKNPRITLTLAKGLDYFGSYLQKELAKVGMIIKLDYVELPLLIEKIQKKELAFYFLGWKFDLGDPSDFLKNVVHSYDFKNGYGEYNGGNYFNKEVDRLIEEAEVMLNQKERRKKIQRIMEIIVDEDIMGIPLFESQFIYAARPELIWIPRLDGYFLASELEVRD